MPIMRPKGSRDWMQEYRIVIWILGAICIGNLFAEVLRAVSAPFETDYVLFFRLAGYMVLHNVHGLYCLSCQHQLMASLYGVVIRHGVDPWVFIFANPPFVALVFVPLALLSPAAGLDVYLGLALLALAASGVLLMRQYPRLMHPSSLVMLCSFPAMQVFALAQIDVFMFAVASVGCVLIERKNHVQAGMLLSLAFAKPQLIWILIPALAVLRLWRVLLGVAAGGLLLFLLSLLTVGWAGLLEWIRALTHIGYGVSFVTVSIPGVLVRLHLTHPVIDAASCFLAAGCLLMLARYRNSFAGDSLGLFGVVFAVTLAVTPHILPYNLVFIAFPLLALARSRMPLAVVFGCAISCAYLLDVVVPLQWSVAELVVVVVVCMEMFRMVGQMKTRDQVGRVEQTTA